MNLSPTQFETLASDAEAYGGFTAIPKGKFAGLSPRNKLLVGQRDVPEGQSSRPARGADIASYAQGNEATLDKPNRYLGGWVAQDSLWNDVPKGFPNTAKGEVAARRSTMSQDQKAYGRTGPDRMYAGTTHNPYHDVNRDPFNVAGRGPDISDDSGPGETATRYYAGDRRTWVEHTLRMSQFGGNSQ